MTETPLADLISPDLAEVMAPFTELLEDAVALGEFHEMIAERVPALRPRLAENLAGFLDELKRVFSPYIDFAEGRTTQEEFLAVLAEREAASIRQREDQWGEPDEDGLWLVDCDTCGNFLELEELPPLRPLCESCRQEEAEDRAAEKADRAGA